MKIPHLVALVGLMLLSVAATSASPNYDCGGERLDKQRSPAPEALPTLAGSSWILLAMGDGGNLRTVDHDPPIILDFLDDARLAGSTGCNGYSGDYNAAVYRSGFSDPNLRMLNIAISESGCPTPELFERESEYMDYLADARYVTLTRDVPQLIIETLSRQVLVFGPS